MVGGAAAGSMPAAEPFGDGEWLAALAPTTGPSLAGRGEVSMPLGGRSLPPSNSPLGWPLIGTLVLCALVMIIDGYDLQAMPLAVPHVVREWGIEPSGFGIALSAVLVGLGAGALLLAPFGDRVGRRPVVLISTTAIAVSMAGTATASSITEFAFWRLATGTALGACLPNVTALVAELAPVHRRAGLLTIVSCGVSLGGLAAGFVAPLLVDAGGWQSIFTCSGAMTLLLVLILFLALPESPKFLADRKTASAPGGIAEPRASMLAPLAPAHRFATFVFAGLYMVNALALYMLASWVPTILPQAGFSLADAARMAGLVQGGGLVAALALSWFLDRSRTVAAMIGSYLLVAASLVAFSFTPPAPLSWGTLLLIVGGGISGAHLALMAVGTTFYPPRILSSAIGLAVAVARVGAIAGPMIGSWLVARGAGPELFFLVLMIPVLICAAGVTMIPAAQRSRGSSGEDDHAPGKAGVAA
jgi:AAHS family 4-hydroxybenzoate transporter-like MFS transporter